jgi:Trk K+ transport system NAD-binding subunit
MRQGKQMLIPRPDLKLAEGDNLLLLTESKELVDKVERQLKNES